MSKPAPRLGKGLSALISPHSPPAEPPAATEPNAGSALRELPTSSIQANSRQPRKQFDTAAIEKLADSIRRTGVLQPVLVRPVQDGRFELLAGERRWRAATAAGLEHVPAIIRDATDAQAIEVALIENLQREDLRPLERATAYREYMSRFDVGADDLAQRLGESRANVSNYIRLLKLSDDIRAMIESGELGMGQARAIAGIEDPQRQLAIARLAVRRNLAVRQVEALAQARQVEHERKQATPDGAARHLEELAGGFSRSLGLRVQLQSGKKKNSGRVIIHFDNLDQFDRIAEAIGGAKAVE
ncbi:MAG: ParB/RepB/Spo0J family partition protein [Phycisphaerae bacterium]|jgi:ParB family chromosome partitioning protein